MSTSVGSDGATGSPAAPHGKKKRGTATYVVWGLLAFMVSWAILSIVMAPEVESIEKFKPQNEFGLHPWVSINLGPLDLSINKAVMYLALSSLIAIIFGLVVVKRGLAEKPGDGQNILEIAYEFIENTIAKATLPPKMFARYFPYVATLFLFIAINNLISFIPLPGGEESAIGWVPDLGLYAATANLNVTLALTLCTFFIYNYEGIREHGPFGYLKTFVPAGDIHPIMKAVVFALEFLSNILRLVSLSVRLFANMLAGHLLIIMASGFAIILGSFVGLVALPFGVFFYFFEWVLIAGLQAFIFAMLSGIYIGFAVEHGH